MPIKHQQEPKQFHEWQYELNCQLKKEFHSQVSDGLYSVFEPGWDLGDTPCPGNLALWLEAGPFTGCKRTCWLKVNLLLTNESGCSVVGYVCIFGVEHLRRCVEMRKTELGRSKGFLVL